MTRYWCRAWRFVMGLLSCGWMTWVSSETAATWNAWFSCFGRFHGRCLRNPQHNVSWELLQADPLWETHPTGRQTLSTLSPSNVWLSLWHRQGKFVLGTNHTHRLLVTYFSGTIIVNVKYSLWGTHIRWVLVHQSSGRPTVFLRGVRQLSKVL